jgi:hypothetical protein
MLCMCAPTENASVVGPFSVPDFLGGVDRPHVALAAYAHLQNLIRMLAYFNYSISRSDKIEKLKWSIT